MDQDDTKDTALSHSESTENKEDPSDKLTPEHPRFKKVIEDLHSAKEQNEDLKRQLDELKAKVDQRQEQEHTDTVTDDEQKALDKIDRELKRRGYLTKAEQEEHDRIERRASQLTALSSEFNGKNGLPKFIPDEVVAFAKANGFGENYRAAYREMHFDAIVQLQSKGGGSGNRPPGSEPPNGGERNAPKLDITSDDIARMSDEEYEKNREKILKAIKPR